MVTGSNDVDEIYQRMAEIRREHHTNVRESVAGAEAMADWGRYTWTYPWVALGAAAAVGFLIYTGGHQKVTDEHASLADGDNAGEPFTGASGNGQGRSWPSRSLMFTVWDILFPVAVRAGQNYMLHWLEQQYPKRTTIRTASSPSAAERGSAMGQVE